MSKFIYPVPVNSQISQFFSERPAFYRKLGFKGHPGLDFAVSEGDFVFSTSWGEVIELGISNKGYGVFIKILHGNIISLYAHLLSINVVRGCYITQGQKIARSGNSGYSSGPHLHFAFLDPKKLNNGYKGYIDPLPLLEKQGGDFTNKEKKIQAEINQIKKDGYTKASMYIHTKYIDKILNN